MKITEASLTRFSEWLAERGRGGNTAEIYRSHLRQSHKDGAPSTARLIGELSPNTKRGALAALAAWAKFSKDDDLRERLDAIRLPPARRVTAKLPLTADEWRRYVTHLRTGVLPKRDARLRPIMVIIAIRGLRCGDALRIKRHEITAALATGKLSFEAKRGKRTEFSCRSFTAELEELASYKGDWKVVRDLVSPTSKAASKRIWRRMRALAEGLEIHGVYPHRLRRTYATRFLSQLQGDPQAIIKLQKHMDWESLATAASYADAVDLGELDQVGGRMVDDLLR